MKKNPEREKEIYDLWIKGYKIAQIAELTGYATSTVGYYTKKFKDREKRRGYSGPSIDEIVSSKPSRRKDFDIDRIVDGKPRIKSNDIINDLMGFKIKKSQPQTEETQITHREKFLEIDKKYQMTFKDYYEIMRNTFIQLIEQGQYMQAEVFCNAILSYFNLSQKFTDILQRRKKIRTDDALVLAAIFDPENYKKVYGPTSK